MNRDDLPRRRPRRPAWPISLPMRPRLPRLGSSSGRCTWTGRNPHTVAGRRARVQTCRRH